MGKARAVAGNMAASATIPPLMLWMLNRRSGLDGGASLVVVVVVAVVVYVTFRCTGPSTLSVLAGVVVVPLKKEKAHFVI